jgi:UDP-2,4-diacetamido-2,4,6-trideoxy-beta-L-altropyranose hydrolase
MIVFRCDGNDVIGYGHFFRSLSLAAAALKRGHKVVIATELITPVVEHYAKFYEIPLWQGILTNDRLLEWNTQWVVVDGYHLSADQTRRFVSELQVLQIDDLATQPIDADILVNPNFGSDRLPYVMGRSSVELLGPQYAPLRPEFSQPHAAPTARKLLVCLGGGDNTAALQEILEKIPTSWGAITLVPGGSKVESAPGIEIVDRPSDMAKVMRECTHAVVGAGSIIWECLALGLKTAGLKLYENQDIVARELAARDFIIWLNPSGELESEHLMRLFDDSIQLPAPPPEWRDAMGASRVLEQIEHHTHEPIVRLARMADAKAVWEINNDPVARQNAVNHDPIPLQDHLKWFEASLVNENRFLWVLEDDSHVHGVVRADFNQDDARISIAVAAKSRGQGVGGRLLSAAVERLEKMGSCRTISAIIRPKNTASVRVFEKAGFQFQRDEILSDERFLFFERGSATE